MILNMYGHIQEKDRAEMAKAFEKSFYGQGTTDNQKDMLELILEQIKNIPDLLQKTLAALNA